MKKLSQISFIYLFLLSIGISHVQAINTYVSFDGSNDDIEYPNDTYLARLNNATNYTIETWVKIPTGANTGRNIAARGGSFGIKWEANDVINFYVKNSSWYYYSSDDNALPDDNAWHHIAIIRNTTAGTLEIYVDGVDVFSTVTSGQSMGSSTNKLQLAQSGIGDNLECDLEEFRIKDESSAIGDLHTNIGDPEYTSDSKTVVLFHFNEGSGLYTLNEASGTNATLNDGVTWASGSSPLPIELISFSAKNYSNTITLDWKTASEINIQGFEIQRSSDFENWEVIGFVNGTGKSNQVQDYTYIDNDPNTINYYRLKKIDFDGKFEFSDIEFVMFSRDGQISIYPNPVSNSLNIDGLEIGNTKSIDIYNYTGKLVKQITNNFSTLDISELSSGIYFIKIRMFNKDILSEKFVKE